MAAPRSDATDRHTARQARLAALVMAGTAVVWMGAQALGGALGWPARYVFLFDFAALAGLFWALVVTYQVWRKRRTARTGGE
ncbi:hypothetical protein DKT77_20020 [Meridianimarinicoccus roseus]|jgi:hypothetical protein|uniref:DUF5337 domain-containing protein n=1 Tax=Meridianimarinicoccus roseus TaxID=2072018 RepID=A0A2V2L690_9RHOB|nr:DUF5337 domain-containing protein [Meridianimarinicoccus roseus]PWR00820.1 hypothetical protein DKT77_20020 [Meridianimarinicoccus roseus]